MDVEVMQLYIADGKIGILIGRIAVRVDLCHHTGFCTGDLDPFRFIIRTSLTHRYAGAEPFCYAVHIEPITVAAAGAGELEIFYVVENNAIIAAVARFHLSAAIDEHDRFSSGAGKIEELDVGITAGFDTYSITRLHVTPVVIDIYSAIAAGLNHQFTIGTSCSASGRWRHSCF